MMPSSTERRCARFAGVALLVVTVFAAGCGRPPDEAWLRFLGFKQSSSTISTFTDHLREEINSTVDVELQNSSLVVGKTDGVGIQVNRARVDYRMDGFSPPSSEFPVNLYLAPPAESKLTTGTLTTFPLVSASLKHWLIDTGAFDDATVTPVVELNAQVTFFGVGDDGGKLETQGGIGIALTNTGVTSTKPTVTVTWTRNVSQLATKNTGATGAFTVYRANGSFAAKLPIEFTTSGTPTAGTDYTIIFQGFIPALANSAEIDVAPITNGATGTVIITLTNTSFYTVGAPASASLQITQ